MTGPEHYREAEELLRLATQPAGRASPADRAEDIAMAQVHATLALAAGVADLITEAALANWKGSS